MHKTRPSIKGLTGYQSTFTLMNSLKQFSSLGLYMSLKIVLLIFFHEEMRLIHKMEKILLM